MDKFYTSEKNTQILIALMKFHGVRQIVASPGATNVCLIGSLQHDPYFEMYSSVDERSAAYIACGLARDSGEPVALSCTGATASRNYVPGLTEAFYSNLPVLAITSTQHIGRVGQLMPQVIDRSNSSNDIVKKSVQISTVHDQEDEWAAGVEINDALLELRRHGGGPAHINLTTTYSPDFSARELPEVKGISRYCAGEMLPELKAKKVAVCIGAHCRWTNELTKYVDLFSEKYNAAVIYEQISNYKGKYGVNPTLLANQTEYRSPELDADVMIHLGTVAGFGCGHILGKQEVWRVHPDGEVRDTFYKLTKVFEMQELDFFKAYVGMEAEKKNSTTYLEALRKECKKVSDKVPDLPFSNAWIAKNTVSLLPNNCELYLGILNSLRSWTLFDIDFIKNIDIHSNTGGFGIDGLVSTLLGASLSNLKKLYIGVIGDLAFFYDMNAVGNRHVSNNLRLMVVNNGRGTEFRNYNHPAARFEEDADAYMAAAGHYGNKSPELIKSYADALGFEYLSAHSKEEYQKHVRHFLTSELTCRPMLFEVFTDTHDESYALKTLFTLESTMTGAAKNTVKNALGEKGVSTLKKFLGRNN